MRYATLVSSRHFRDHRDGGDGRSLAVRPIRGANLGAAIAGAEPANFRSFIWARPPFTPAADSPMRWRRSHRNHNRQRLMAHARRLRRQNKRPAGSRWRAPLKNLYVLLALGTRARLAPVHAVCTPLHPFRREVLRLNGQFDGVLEPLDHEGLPKSRAVPEGFG